MSKDTFYFSHDYNARNDEKILELRSAHGAEGYGVFWMIVETMAENKNAGINRSLMAGLSLSYGLAKDKLSLILDHCVATGLFYEENGVVFSKRLKVHKEFRNERSVSGKHGADKRYGKSNNDTRLNGSAIGKL